MANRTKQQAIGARRKCSPIRSQYVTTALPNEDWPPARAPTALFVSVLELVGDQEGDLGAVVGDFKQFQEHLQLVLATADAVNRPLLLDLPFTAPRAAASNVPGK